MDTSYADIIVLCYIFCVERIRILINDIIHILIISRRIIFAMILCFYAYSYVAYRLFERVSPKYFSNIFISMLSMF
jgi:hypothetical protein